MTTKSTAKIRIENHTGGESLIQLYHFNSYYKKWESATWTVNNGDTSPSSSPLTVTFPTGIGFGATALDFWAVQVSVMKSSQAGIYGSKNQLKFPPYAFLPWGLKECMLTNKDAGKTLTFSVTKTTFEINLNSGSCNDDLVRIRDYSPITNIFVLMLENHSCDNIFGASGIEGLKVPPIGASNSYNGTKYPFSNHAPFYLTSDPGHEFNDVVQQLKGDGGTYYGGSYGTINNSGYVSNYATSTTEGPPPSSQYYGDVMNGFNTAVSLPVIYQLATNYAICDQWFSSLPGPTWPNRFFLHGASSVGMDDSPNSCDITTWESVAGFKYPNGSIFDRLNKNKIPWRLYNDMFNSYSDNQNAGSAIGGIPQVGALKGITAIDYNNVTSLKDELKAPYPWVYTFIEPNYGNVGNGSFKGGSSQHPMDDMYGGEALIKAVYEAIRNSPVWASSLLIITYDEHGGFYDSQVPGTTVNPGDVTLPSQYTSHNFNFQQLGVRVPAVVVSPLIKKGTVDHTVYDHSSVIKTILNLTASTGKDSSPLTARDGNANDLSHLLTQTILSGKSPNNGPTTLNNPTVTSPPPAPLADPGPTGEEIRRQPIPRSGNLQGFLQIALKFEAELVAGDEIKTQELVHKFKQMKTLEEAQDYLKKVDELISKAREAQAREFEGSPLAGKGAEE